MSPLIRTEPKRFRHGDRVYEIDRGGGNQLGAVYDVGRAVDAPDGKTHHIRRPRRKLPPHLREQVLRLYVRQLKKKKERQYRRPTDRRAIKVPPPPDPSPWPIRFVRQLWRTRWVFEDQGVRPWIRRAWSNSLRPVPGD